MKHYPYYIRFGNKLYYGLLFLWTVVLLGPQVGFGGQQSGNRVEALIEQKVPAGVLAELEAGRYQDLIVEFEHQDIRGGSSC